MKRRKLLTYQQAAQYLSLPLGSLYSLVHLKRIPHVRLSPRVVRFDEAELDAWLDARSVAAEDKRRVRDLPLR